MAIRHRPAPRLLSVPRPQPWPLFRIKRRKRPGLAAVKWQQRQEERARLKAQWAEVKRWRPPERPHDYDEPRQPLLRRRRGPMEIWELFEWHRANGTLAVFYAMFPPPR